MLSILTVMGTVAVVGPILAQSVSPAAFDVTSIKPNNTGSGAIFDNNGHLLQFGQPVARKESES